ncbi:DUF1801 domain-containing protein [Variovorax sp. J22P271]|uniref:DUF1801 domain-containing protein n=1 Tax=Variovorax davisae TaxID=3053515 RepID=UPI0025787007|nr:DUF1801 domain-containing protein [Variovorax sp. J22P271]MDM0031864.1 DUF1801 domain-containing protein [Variovorax sp. J22P271]
MVDPQKHQIAVALRKEILRLARTATEKMIYGGVLYCLDDSFCGIFSYKTHVSLEFGEGYRFHDPARLLEGAGKYRRHLKFKQLSDIRDKHAALYIEQAIALVSG